MMIKVGNSFIREIPEAASVILVDSSWDYSFIAC